MRKLIKTNGEEIDFATKISSSDVAKLIGAACLTSIMLADGTHAMCIDDTGLIDGRPINPKATLLYWQKYGPNDNAIHGDVLVVPDADYA